MYHQACFFSPLWYNEVHLFSFVTAAKNNQKQTDGDSFPAITQACPSHTDGLLWGLDNTLAVGLQITTQQWLWLRYTL